MRLHDYRVVAASGALCVAFLVVATINTLPANAQPPSKLQGVFNTVRQMPLRSPLAAHAAGGLGGVPSALSQQSGSWAPTNSQGAIRPSQASRVLTATGKAASSPHNLPEPPQQEPVFSSEPDGGTEDMLPFFDGNASGNASTSPHGGVG